MVVRLNLPSTPSVMPAPEDPPAIEFTRVGKRFRLRDGRTLAEFVPSLLQGRGFAPPFWALRDVSFAVGPHETLGIIGRNGSGKSTILKLISGVMAPTEGTLSVRGRVAPLLELGAGFHPDLTGIENLYLKGSILGLSNADIRARAEQIIEFAEMRPFIDTPVKRYSSGMYVRLAFSIIIHSSPEILLVDEALAVGDASFREKCVERMAGLKAAGVPIVLVSHAMDLVAAFCDRVIVLEGGSVAFEGEPAPAVEEYVRIAGVHPAAGAAGSGALDGLGPDRFPGAMRR